VNGSRPELSKPSGLFGLLWFAAAARISSVNGPVLTSSLLPTLGFNNIFL